MLLFYYMDEILVNPLSCGLHFFLLITCACLKDLLISTFRNLTCSFCHSVCTGCSVCPGFVFFRIFYIL